MKKSSTQYYISYEHDGNHGFIASAPAIPGCVVYGKTLKEAYENIRSAIRECIEVIQEFRQLPPQETIRPEIIKKISFVKLKEYAEA